MNDNDFLIYEIDDCIRYALCMKPNEHARDMHQRSLGKTLTCLDSFLEKIVFVLQFVSSITRKYLNLICFICL